MTSTIKKVKSALPTLSIKLENQGSVARDHMSNERTYLSWVRTSTATVAAGVAIVQLFRIKETLKASGALTTKEDDVDERIAQFHTRDDDDEGISDELAGKIIGACFIILSIVMMGIGTMRYFQTQNMMRKGIYSVSRITVCLCTLVLIGLFTGMMACVMR
ncbi:hypothetical protein IWQ62_001309 [Dispira parvispora]|uniref:DUF202 domain-containing protein n=1 Tax=Dispira parvispora TaxID=1520584 RepID=A0A9W8E408_9FUNG|nr:hypothetical protein IWQ62_001309 [Dispira parvispora]